MNAADIAELAYNAGIRNQSDLQAAVAIALAESGGRENAEGDLALQNATWGPSIGLWQIRSLKAESGKGTVRDATRLKDPAFNAKAMFAISNGGKNWGPWTTWPLRAAGYMPQAIGAASGTLLKNVGNTSGTSNANIGEAAVDAVVPDGLEAVEAGLTKTSAWVADRNNWFRVAKVAIGGVLIVGGVFLVAKPLVTNVIASEAGKVAGKVLKGKI